MKALFILSLVALHVTLPLRGETIAPLGNTWRYLDDGSVPPDNWTRPEFDDSAWSEGPAPLGYGEADIVTIVSFGENGSQKHPNTFARLRVDSDGTEYPHYRIRLRVDDGAVVYWDGVELGRPRMPESFELKSYAAEVVGNEDEGRFVQIAIPKEMMGAGNHVLAISIHQSSPNSSDLYLDAEVLGLTDEEIDLRYQAELDDAHMKQIMSIIEGYNEDFSAYRVTPTANSYPNPKVACSTMLTLVAERPKAQGSAIAAAWVARFMSLELDLIKTLYQHHEKNPAFAEVCLTISNGDEGINYLKSLLNKSEHAPLRGKIALAVARQSNDSDTRMTLFDLALALIPASDRLHQIAEIERAKAVNPVPDSRE